MGAPHSEQHNSINCSSEELLWDTDPNPAATLPSTARLLGTGAFRLPQKSPAGMYYLSFESGFNDNCNLGNKTPVWPEAPMESSTPIYDVPPRTASRNATPRPVGDEATPHAQWWLLQVFSNSKITQDFCSDKKLVELPNKKLLAGLKQNGNNFSGI